MLLPLRTYVAHEEGSGRKGQRGETDINGLLARGPIHLFGRRFFFAERGCCGKKVAASRSPFPFLIIG